MSRQVEVVCQADAAKFGHISSVALDPEGNVYAVSTQSGDIYKVGAQGLQSFASSAGQPSAADFDSAGELYICDFAHQGILLLSRETHELSELVKEFEGAPLKGPNDLVFDNNGTLYFTDSGPLGETSIQRPKGSVFSITAEGLLNPIAVDCLAYPAGIALSPDQQIIYVAETMNNRILRFVQYPSGVFHFSVFYQFSGSVGPMSIACDNEGRIIVGHFDFATCTKDGRISIISAEGRLVDEIAIPGAPEIAGLKLTAEKDVLYLCEASTNSIFRIVL